MRKQTILRSSPTSKSAVALAAPKTETILPKKTFWLPNDRPIITALAPIGSEQIALTTGASERFKGDVYKLLQIKHDPKVAKKPYNLYVMKQKLVQKFLGKNVSTKVILFTDNYSTEYGEFVIHYMKMSADLPIREQKGTKVALRRFFDLCNYPTLPGQGGKKIIVPRSVQWAVKKRPVFLKLANLN